MSTKKEFEKKVHIYSCMYSFLFFYLRMILNEGWWKVHIPVCHTYILSTHYT